MEEEKPEKEWGALTTCLWPNLCSKMNVDKDPPTLPWHDVSHMLKGAAVFYSWGLVSSELASGASVRQPLTICGYTHLHFKLILNIQLFSLTGHPSSAPWPRVASGHPVGPRGSGTFLPS